MNSSSRAVKLTIEYEGTEYHGWQRQPNVLTIQEVLEKVLESVVGIKTNITGAGRTDSGVHALAQTASFQTESTIPDFQLQKALNARLPDDIVVKNVQTVPDDFHARFSAKSKLYRYTILNCAYGSAFDYRYAWHIKKKNFLRIDSIKESADCLIGEHDFSSFRASKCCSHTNIRKISRLDIRQEGKYYYFWFEGDGFLTHMVRIIVGTLVKTSYDRLPPSAVEKILLAKDRREAGPTAPAHGLCMVEVKY